MPDQSAETTVRAFLTKWICTYGVPRKVITDRGSNFVSELFQELHKFLGIKPINMCAYRPQGNGMNERTHKELHEYLAMYLRPANRQTWDTMLNVASWIHNSTEHESLGMSPFEIMTGVKPRSAQSWIPTQGENIKEISEKFQHYYNVDRKYLEELREKAKIMIGKAQTDYLTRINKYSKEMKYKVGDKVLIRIQDRSTYVSRKWSAKYKGPYIVKAIIGPGVVKIQEEETGYNDLNDVVYLRPYNEKSPPPSKDDDSGIKSMEIEQTPYTDPNKKKQVNLPAGTGKRKATLIEPEDVYEDICPEDIRDEGTKTSTPYTSPLKSPNNASRAAKEISQEKGKVSPTASKLVSEPTKQTPSKYQRVKRILKGAAQLVLKAITQALKQDISESSTTSSDTSPPISKQPSPIKQSFSKRREKKVEVEIESDDEEELSTEQSQALRRSDRVTRQRRISGQYAERNPRNPVGYARQPKKGIKKAVKKRHD
jgi:hypothetical protein